MTALINATTAEEPNTTPACLRRVVTAPSRISPSNNGRSGMTPGVPPPDEDQPVEPDIPPSCRLPPSRAPPGCLARPRYRAGLAMLAVEFHTTRGDDEMTQPPPGPGPSSHGHNPQQGWQSQRNRRTPGTPPGRPPFPAHPVGTSRPTPRPPRKSTRPLVLAYSCGALLLSLVLVLVYVFATGTGPSSADNELLEPAAPTPTPSPPAASSTTEQSPSSSESPSSSPSDTVTPTEGDPPPQKIFKLADHPILQDPDAGLANRACHLPGWRSTPEGAEAFFTAARECLD